MGLKIIHLVLGKANPNRMNGVNKVVNSLAENQANMGYDVWVWGITKQPVHDYPERQYNTKLFLDKGKFSLDPEIYSELLNLKDKELVFHIHGGFISQFYFVAKALVKYSIPYVFTPHGAYNLVALERSKLKKKVFIKLFENFLVKHAKSIHLIGNSEVNGTFETFGEVPAHLIPNGQSAMTKKTTNFSQKRNQIPVFGFVGRLDMHTKGLDKLIEGFAEMTSKYMVNSELWFIGDGPDKEKLMQMAQNLGILHHMKFLGAKYGSEKDELLEQVDFLCLFSRNEGLPGVVLEAAAIGIPAIVSEETNMGDYILSNKAGWVIRKCGSKSIGETMAEAAKNTRIENYSKLSENAFQMVVQQFNWELIAEKHMKAYAA